MFKLRLIILLALFYCGSILSMIDNRFLPLYRQLYTRQCDKRSASGVNTFFLLAYQARDSEGNEIGLPEINGKYNVTGISKALEITGKPNPFSSQFRTSLPLDLNLEGKLESQGFWLGYEKYLIGGFSFGFSAFVFNLVSRQQFTIPDQVQRDLNLTKGREIIFDQQIREANDLLGLSTYQYKQFGISDLDLYVRFGTVRDYVYKFRKIDLGLELGFLVPNGPLVDNNNPASIPFGGDGHLGIYGVADVNLELKEDLMVGIWLEVLKRLEKVQTKRMPVDDEPQQYGAIVGQARINPGITVGFAPYIWLDDIRDGFGFKFKYSFIYHAEDIWTDVRQDQTIKTQLAQVVKKSSWVNEYLTFTLTYNFAKGVAKPGSFAPIVYFEWDRPSKIFMANQVAKTHRISFGFEFNF